MHKHTSKLLAILLLFASMTLFFGCQDQQPTESNVGNLTGLHKVPQLILPEGTTILSANLWLYYWTPYPDTIEIHNINVPWDETTVTWDDIVGNYDPAVITKFSTDLISPGWKSIDITSTVQGWVNCEPNNGLLLKYQDLIQHLTKWLNKENDIDPTLAPYLEIETSAGTVEVAVKGDTYIRSDGHDINYNNDIRLYCGYLNIAPPDPIEKQTLLQFDVQCTPGGGCTLTPGYWQTHSEYGPAPYDDTWAQLANGADTPFFLSGQTYYEVLWTSPAGNAYYILSFQYIAAELNFLNGADPADAQDAFDQATTLFNTYTPAQIGALKGNDTTRQLFISLGETLDDYNNGLIGPGHCDD